MSIEEQVQRSIEEQLPGAQVRVRGGGGHFEIEVVSAAFEGQKPLARQRIVYQAIRHLMAGDAAPVHAVDRLECKTP